MNTLAASTPAHPNNALDAVVFAVELQQPPSPSAAQAIKAALGQFGQELPGEHTEQPQGIFVATGNALPPFGEAFRFAAKPNGEHAWRVQLTGTTLQVLCTEYTRFDEIWPRALKYLQAMLRFADEALLVTAISHQFVDRFLYPVGMTAEQYRMGELFKEDTPYLTQKSWGSGLQWHVYQGWFDSHTEQRRVLHQLNMTNVEMQLPQLQLTCVIDHRCVQQFATIAPITAKTLVAGENCALDTTMRELHGMHTSTLRDLLQTAKLQEIGMDH